MTVSTTTNKQSYTGNGVTTLYGFAIPFIAASDLQVYVAGVLQTLTTNYTISGSAPYPAGANVTFLVAPANGAAILIVRTRPYTQTLDLVANDPLPADNVEQLLGDHMVMLVQQLKEITDRSFTLPITDTSGASLTVPTPVASQFLGWNSAATALQNYAGTSGVATTAYWAAVIATASDTHLYVAAAGGNTSAMTVTTVPTYVAGAGSVVIFKAIATNTAGVTFNANGGGAVAIRVLTVGGKVALTGNEIINGNTYLVVHDGTNWILLNPTVDVTATIGDNTTKRATTAFVQNTFAATLGNNRIINGGFMTDQRNSGVSQTFTAGAALAYSVDRFYGYCTGANVTGQQIAGAGQDIYRYRFTGAASVTAVGFGTRLEAINTYDLNGQTAVLSVELANSLLTTVTWTAYYATTTDTFGTLASPTRTQIATGNFTVTSTVTKYSASMAIPSAATTGIEIVLTVGAQISGTWTIGAIQLELGAIASAFGFRQYPLELALCQRYYQILTCSSGNNLIAMGQAAGAGEAHAPIVLPVAMRATPTLGGTANLAFLTFNLGASAGGTIALVSSSTPNTAHIQTTGGAGLTAGNASGLFIIGGGNIATFSAEL